MTLLANVCTPCREVTQLGSLTGCTANVSFLLFFSTPTNDALRLGCWTSECCICPSSLLFLWRRSADPSDLISTSHRCVEASSRLPLQSGHCPASHSLFFSESPSSKLEDLVHLKWTLCGLCLQDKKGSNLLWKTKGNEKRKKNQKTKWWFRLVYDWWPTRNRGFFFCLENKTGTRLSYHERSVLS